MTDFQIIENNSKKCLAGKILVYFSNIILWTSMVVILFAVIFYPETSEKKLIGFFCAMGFIVVLFFLTSFAPDLNNPSKKKEQALIEKSKQLEKKEIVKVKEDVNVNEEFYKSVNKASKVKESESLDPSVFN